MTTRRVQRQASRWALHNPMTERRTVAKTLKALQQQARERGPVDHSTGYRMGAIPEDLASDATTLTVGGATSAALTAAVELIGSDERFEYMTETDLDVENEVISQLVNPEYAAGMYVPRVSPAREGPRTRPLFCEVATCGCAQATSSICARLRLRRSVLAPNWTPSPMTSRR